MNSLLERADSILNVWGEAIWRGTWQGGLVLLAIAVLIYALKLSPAYQCWLIRLGWIKFVLILACPFALAIPLLPESFDSGSETQVSQSSTHETSADNNNSIPMMKQRDFVLNENVDVLNEKVEYPSGESVVLSELKPVDPQTQTAITNFDNSNKPNANLAANTQQHSDTSSAGLWGLWRVVRLGVASLWLVGFVFYFSQLIASGIRVHRLRMKAQPIRDSRLYSHLSAIVREVSRKRPPILQTIPGSGSPMLMGIFKPTILIPEQLLKHCSSQELKLVLGHEVAHLARRDLWWNWLGAIVHTVFFFHPLVWWASKRAMISQELACDERVLRREHEQVGEYAKLLLKVLVLEKNKPLGSLGTVGVAGEAGTLKERLLAMKNRTEKRSGWWTGSVLTVTCAALVLPWQLVAQEKENASQEKSAAEQKVDKEASASTSVRSSSSSSQSTGSSRPMTRVFSSSNGTGRTIATGGSSDQDVVVNESSSDQSNVQSLVHTQDGKTLKIEVRDGKFTVTRSTKTEAESKSETFKFESADEFKSKLPEEFARYQSMTKRRPSTGITVSGGGSGRTSARGEMTRAQQMMLENLQQLREQAGDNEQMRQLIDQMIEDARKNGSNKTYSGGSASGTSSSSSSSSRSTGSRASGSSRSTRTTGSGSNGR